MQEFVNFILVDGSALTFANVVSFFAFTILIGSVVLICQALMRPTIQH